jgi:molybdate transport system regulatory protein
LGAPVKNSRAEALKSSFSGDASVTPNRKANLQPAFRLSLEEGKRVVIDQTDALLLRRVSESGSLTEAAKLAGISYRNAWDRIKAVESSLGTKILETKVGGSVGGGAVLTPDGESLLREFRKVRKYLFEVLDEQEFMAHASYKLSARNRLRVKVEKVEKGEVISIVKMKVVGPAPLTSIISTEAVEDLDLKAGDEAVAIIKSTEVILAKNSSEGGGVRLQVKAAGD